MLDGLEVTEIKLSEMLVDNEDFRYDSDFFRKTYLKSYKRLKELKSDYLGNVSVEIKSFGAYSLTNQVSYLESGIPFIRCTNIKDGVVDFSNVLFIDKEANKLLWKSEVKPGMVLLTMSGSIGSCAVAMDTWEYPMNSNQDVAKISLQKGMNPYFVSTFLNTNYGQQQINRYSVGSVQQHIFLWQLEKLLIPKLSLDFQKQIEKTVKTAHAKLEQSKRLYAEAEETLLEELGLKNIDIAESRYNIGKFSNIEAFGRMDAEYYKRKYENLLSYISSKDNFTLEQIADFSGGATPLGADYQESGIPFLRIQNVGENKLALDDVVFINEGTHEGLLNRSRLSPRDVLLTVTGRIGTTAVVPEDLKEANINQHIVRMRLKDKSINPYYLAAFLNSIGGKLQTERESYGTTRDALPYYCLSKIRILKANSAFQKQIEKMILKADAMEQESKRLLEMSKRAVEVSIERGGSAGMKVLE